MYSPTYHGLDSPGIESCCVRFSRQAHKPNQPPIQRVPCVLLWMKRPDLFLNTYLLPVPKRQWEVGSTNFRDLTGRQVYGARILAYVFAFLGVINYCLLYQLTH